MKTLDSVALGVENCKQCPRLRSYCAGIAIAKKRAHKLETYWGKPVPGFGDAKAVLWIIGLAPAAHGANRTGRMFTGDSSGDWLYRALFQVGLANQPESVSKTDGMTLKHTYISAAARCAPPDNKPTPKELENCETFLDAEFDSLKGKKVVLCLGKIAFDATLKMLERKGLSLPKPKPKFVHAGVFHVENLSLVTSYHPSRQNTNTGRLTWSMWIAIFESLGRFATQNSSGTTRNFESLTLR